MWASAAREDEERLREGDEDEVALERDESVEELPRRKALPVAADDDAGDPRDVVGGDVGTSGGEEGTLERADRLGMVMRATLATVFRRLWLILLPQPRERGGDWSSKGYSIDRETKRREQHECM